jgi:intracellular septation protein
MAESAQPAPAMGLQRLAIDVLAGWIFLALFLITDDIYLATAGGMAAGIGQIVWALTSKQTIDPMQWMALILIIGLGGSSILTRNPTFVVLKPSIFEGCLAAMMLRPGWMVRYSPSRSRQSFPRLLVAWGYVWAAAWFALAVSNILVERAFGLKGWAIYTSFSPLVLVATLSGLGAMIFTLTHRAFRPAGAAALGQVSE